ncbi:MAG: chemotaxis-specific protein-glutamate methyltransferase CheB [Aliishimia sp.]
MKHISDDATPFRVAVVDDSRSIRAWLRHVLDADPRLKVVGEAGSGPEARALLRQKKIDVMTLDIDMPGMSGIDFLARLMAHHPLPVVMVSALTEAGSEAAVKALSLGAVDCIAKPRSALKPNIAEDICARVYHAASVKVQTRKTSLSTPSPSSFVGAGGAWSGGVILLGASTGGVTALESLLAEIDGCAAPVIIAQHMPENFLKSFNRRLNEQLKRKFVLAKDGLVLEAGQGVLALGKEVSTHLVSTPTGGIQCVFRPPSKDSLYRPSIDDLFNSAGVAKLTGAAAILTGMGSDGAKGLFTLMQSGFSTYAQEEHSCVVYGMPKAAVELGAAQSILEPQDVGRKIAATFCNIRNLQRELRV